MDPVQNLMGGKAPLSEAMMRGGHVPDCGRCH
jgi:hypothetical protein